MNTFGEPKTSEFFGKFVSDFLFLKDLGVIYICLIFVLEVDWLRKIK
jgi:hypothetical protein